MELRTQFTSRVVAAAALAVCLGAGAGRAAGDVDKGKAAFVRQCAICQHHREGRSDRFGPNLSGMVGKKAGSVPASIIAGLPGRREMGMDRDALRKLDHVPGTMVPGTAMAIFQGVAEKDRDDIVAYLASKK